MRLWWFLSPGLYSLAALDELNIFKEHPIAADARRTQPVRDPLRGVSEGHLRFGDARGTTRLARFRVAGRAARREPRLPRLHDVRLQAARAELREGHLMAVEQAAAADRAAAPATPSTPRTSGSATTCGSPGRRPSANRSGRCSGGAAATEFWALRHVDLHVQRGESLAVIGPNGAGKSTLLQVLAGIIHPSEGVVDVIGHVSGLADPRRRLRQGADRPRQHPARRRIPRARRRGDAPAPAVDHRVRRARRLHRRAAQDLLVRDARPARLRDRDLGRPGHPAARRGARDRRRQLPGQVEGAGHRDRRRRPRRWSS